MGRTEIRLDANGYTYASEPGVWWKVSGESLLRRWSLREKILATDLEGSINQPLLYSPPGSGWLLPSPFQFSSEWNNNTIPGGVLSDYILRQSRWVFASGISPVEFEPTRLPDGTSYPDNKWISIPRTPSTIVPLDNTNFTAIGAAAGVSLPAGMGVVAACFTTPNNRDIGEADYHPFVQWAAYPAPKELFCFGFSDLCFLAYDQILYVLRSPSASRQSWILYAKIPLGHSYGLTRPPVRAALGTGSVVSAIPELRLRSLLPMPVGPDTLWVHPNSGDPVPVRLRESIDPTVVARLFVPGAWWVAAPPKTKLAWQMQVVGYNAGFKIGVGTNLNIFNLGGVYKPTVAPRMNVFSRHHLRTTGDLLSGTSGGYNYKESAWTRDRIEFRLTDEVGNTWVSDGTNTEGEIDVLLLPGNPGASSSTPGGTNKGYLAPALNLLEVRFPPASIARQHSQLVLSDTQYRSFTFSSSLREPDGKRFTIELKDIGEAILTASGLDEREGYPVEVWEDVDNDGTAETLRCAGWMTSPDMEEPATENASRAVGDPLRTVPAREFILSGKGLLARADERWLYLPQMVDPDGGGYIEHTFVVAEVLRQAGFDVTNTNVYLPATDLYSGTGAARLPGTWGWREAETGVNADSPWAPDWDETKLEYAARIGKRWRGWLLFENIKGRIIYRPDEAMSVDNGALYTSAGTIYKTKAGATAAGFPGHYYFPLSRRIESPRANAVRVTSADLEAKLFPHVIEVDTQGLTTRTYKHFLGEIRVLSLVDKLGVDLASRRQLAAVALRFHRRRQKIWKGVVPLAPWDIHSGVDVGSVVTLQDRGDFLIIHCQVEQLKRSVYRTTLTGEKIST